MSERQPIKKSYAAFLIDRPVNASQSQQNNENTILILLNCLRHRLQLTVESKEPEPLNQNVSGNAGPISSLEAKYSSYSSTAKKKTSLYDTLLRLIDEFDASGVAEIFRLLLERRTAIPLFVPNSKKHHLSLLRHIVIPGVNTQLGEDQSLLRVAVVSCCQRNVSETTQIMSSLFNVQSVYRQDLSAGSFSSEPLIAEIGVGCLVMEESNASAKKIQHVLVIHVIGDFKPLWQCLQRYANHLLVEDSTVECERFRRTFLTDEEATDKEYSSAGFGFDFSCIWTPTRSEVCCKFDKKENGFQFRVEGSLAATLSILKDSVIMALDVVSSSSITFEKLLMLHEVPILFKEAYVALECGSPLEIKKKIQQVENLGSMKKSKLFLQMNYLEQAKIQEAKVEHRLNIRKVVELDNQIKKLKEKVRSNTRIVQDHPLLKLFLDILEKEDSCSRVLSFGLFEKELASHGKEELKPLKDEIRKLTNLYSESLSTAVGETDAIRNLKKDLISAKDKLIERALNVEHLWRELSHLYTETEKRSARIQKIPRLAAQHLLDGFPLELLDSDSNVIRQDWIKVVLYELSKLVERKRILVLSVLGVQSSGKSTMLNTMFGIKMRTSVGQCTRGVNMQLLAVEGRPEYDYILLLDTEGTRAPEYHGLPGSEQRDNKMAALSILLSDATIIVIPGENDAAVKEILPIVLMAYEGSELAEKNGGRLSSRIFFLYNRIDTTQENMLENIIQALGISLNTAFKQVQDLTGNLTNLELESPFGSFNLVSSDSKPGKDVVILGNVKSNPPFTVPDKAYGERLVEFREHIHQRVVSNVVGKAWESTTIVEFSSYIEDVWACICSANFNLHFATVVERMTFDQLNAEYKLKERELCEAYMKFFEIIKREMREEKEGNAASAANLPGDKYSSNNNSEDRSALFIGQLQHSISSTLKKLDDEVTVIVEGSGREKFSVQFVNLWESNKTEQLQTWENNLKNAFNRIFLYEHRVENYKKKLRQEINEFFESTKPERKDDGNDELTETFEKIFSNMLCEIRREFPPINVEEEVENVYQNSSVIKSRKIGKISRISVNDKAPASNSLKCYGERESDEGGFLTRFTGFTGLFFRDNKIHNGNGEKKKPNPKEDAFNLCIGSVAAIVDRVAAGKICYDYSIVSSIIQEVDTNITKKKHH